MEKKTEFSRACITQVTFDQIYPNLIMSINAEKKITEIYSLDHFLAKEVTDQ